MIRRYPRLALVALVATVLGFSGAASAQQAPTANPDRLRICAGSEAGNYTFAAREIAQRLGTGNSSAFRQGVEVIFTNGSLDNLRRLQNGECDVGFSQSDVASRFLAENAAAMNSIRQFTSLYREFVHLLCPVSSGWSRIVDIGRAARDGRPARIIVGPEGSGTAESWRAMRQADAALYDRVERIPESVGRVALATVRDSRDTCMLWISGQNSPDMQAANAMSINNPQRAVRMRLIDFDDRDIRNLRGPNGQPLFEVAQINRVAASGDNPGRYSNLIERGTLGGGSVNVLAVNALLMIRDDYRRAIGTRGDRLIQAIEDAAPTINARVNPQ
jgi:TRAP-type uncharacterized transport system substrate-binding protein